MSDATPPLNFADIKSKVRIEWVFDRERLSGLLKPSARGLIGPCPLHGGNNKRQFRIDTDKQLFRCFSPKCGVAGDVITLVAHLHQVSPREAAALLAEWFAIAAPPRARRNAPMANTDKGRAPDYRAFTVRGEGDDAWWTRIGSAWSNKAGGINIQLDALPLDGKIVLMVPKPDEDEQPAKKGKR